MKRRFANRLMKLSLFVALSLSLFGCGGTEAKNDNVEDVDSTTQELSASFRATCKNIVYHHWTNTWQWVDADCRRRNGTYMHTSINVCCIGDIANCDGNLRCGSC